LWPKVGLEYPCPQALSIFITANHWTSFFAKWFNDLLLQLWSVSIN
jgi:hypothetical protein